MRRRETAMILAGAACLSLLLAGFVAFATLATRRLDGPTMRADGIVVLTGGSDRRIEAGLTLLRANHGERLLISGINPRTKPAELLALFGAERDACCIDLGYEALDTIGNAIEARNWAAYHGYTRLVVVTSSYHMPRGLNELALAMPGVELIAHPVLPRLLREGVWWASPSAWRLLAAEYLKLLPSLARLGVHRALTPREPGETPIRTGPGPQREASL